MATFFRKPLLSFLLTSLCAAASTLAHAQLPACPNVHVWYTLDSDSPDAWEIQIARLYENNISFVDETCAPLNLDTKISLRPGLTRYLGMKVDSETGFYATYSFMGVKTGAYSSSSQIPRGVPACAFIVAPYGPGQMDRVDWKTNNADCYAMNLGTELHFK